MPKPSRDNIDSGSMGWDSLVNNNFIRTFDRPLPIFLHTGTELTLEATFPAASYEESMVAVDHTTLGLTYYVVNKNHPSGSAKWVTLERFNVSPPVTRSTTSSLDWDDEVVLSNPAGAITLTLRPAAEVPGQTLQIKNLSVNPITVSAASNIDGAASFALTVQYQSVTLYSDGATYHIL
jgi:hypothetical protein